jgi:hypothetical protein
MRAEAREYRKREREKMRLKFEAERERRRMEEKKAEMMDKVRVSAEKEKKRLIEDVMRDFVSKGYLSKEEAEEFMEVYLDELMENPESILKKLEEYFGFKAEEARREEQEKDDKESAEILGKTRKGLIRRHFTYILHILNFAFYHCYYLTGVEQDADERTITVAYRELALEYSK